ncbi:MAG TPA: shikimate kinase [Candidatus Acidoferrales bacterium]|nr:shikimate kinase [Candidatus Acidoferrales bacterium]
MSVALTGFMGAGKSTTGRRLAKLLGLRFVDVDAEIELRFGPIAKIFEREGEGGFRVIESALISELSSGEPFVAALGGGAVLDAANRLELRRHAYVVHLSISPRTAHRRVAHRQHRPLLGVKPDLDTISALLTQRAPAYADCDLSIRVDRRSPAQAARIIARWYRDQSLEASRT